MAWVFLALAGLLEVAFTTMLQLVKSSGSWIAVGGFALCVILSFVFLELATRSIPVGTAYAIWTGIGAAGTALIGMAYFGEPASLWRIVFLVTLVGSVIGLKLVSDH